MFATLVLLATAMKARHCANGVCCTGAVALDLAIPSLIPVGDQAELAICVENESYLEGAISRRAELTINAGAKWEILLSSRSVPLPGFRFDGFEPQTSSMVWTGNRNHHILEDTRNCALCQSVRLCLRSHGGPAARMYRTQAVGLGFLAFEHPYTTVEPALLFELLAGSRSVA